MDEARRAAAWEARNTCREAHAMMHAALAALQRACVRAEGAARDWPMLSYQYDFRGFEGALHPVQTYVEALAFLVNDLSAWDDGPVTGGAAIDDLPVRL